MTPYEIDVLLWYFARAEDHPDAVRNPPVWNPTIAMFIVDHKVVRYVSEGERDKHHPMMYELTDRGKAYCEALKRVPLPIQVWVMPPAPDAVDPVNRISCGCPRATDRLSVTEV